MATIDITTEAVCQFYDSTRMINCIFNPNKNWLKTLWQFDKPILDSELNERCEIDNFIRRNIHILLSGEISIVKGLSAKQAWKPLNTPLNVLVLSAGEITARGYQLIVEKNGSPYCWPSLNQNFYVYLIDQGTGAETRYPSSSLGFNPNAGIDQNVGDGNGVIKASTPSGDPATYYDETTRTLYVTILNQCLSAGTEYRVETVDGYYMLTQIIPANSRSQYVIQENLDNYVELPAPPTVSQGQRNDYVYLKMGEQEICSTVTSVFKNGHLSHPISEKIASDIVEPKVGEETTRRTQIQFDLKYYATPPTDGSGWYYFPIFRVLRSPGQTTVVLEDITCLIPKVDLSSTGLLDLFQQGNQLSYDAATSIVDLTDSGVSPQEITTTLGSTITIRNLGPSLDRTIVWTPDGSLDPDIVQAVTYIVHKEGETLPIVCDHVGTFTLVDNSLPVPLLTTVTVTPYGAGTVDLEPLWRAIGYLYRNVRKADDTATPAAGTQLSLDLRVESALYDILELALQEAEDLYAADPVTYDGSFERGYLFVDSISTLLHLTSASRSAATPFFSPSETAIIF